MHPAPKLLSPNHELALRGVRVLVAGPESAPAAQSAGNAADIDSRVQGFLDYTTYANIDITHQFLTLEPSQQSATQIITGMCLWVPAPGKTAMLFIPNQSEHPHSSSATSAALNATLNHLRNHNTILVQAMLEPADAAGKTVFAQAGLSQLATLTYMERKPPLHPPILDFPSNITLEPYSAKTHHLFKQAILQSYIETLDCPALSQMRDIDDVIEGHKAVGPFDPQLWSVALKDGQPAGCLLLAEIPARRGLELVYLGVAPFARGQSLGRALMQRVLAISARRHFDVATLAVDAANTPAVKLYRRCGYSSVAQRVALIKKLV